MSDRQVLPFDDPTHHLSMERLLPWYANGSLDAEEHARVEQHIESCQACRIELQSQGRLMKALRSEERPPLPDNSLARLLGQLERSNSPPRPAAWRQRLADCLRAAAPGLRLTLVSQFMVILVLGGLLLRAPGAPAVYQTRSAAPTGGGSTERILVDFDAGMTMKDLRLALQSVAARIVEGPTDTGVCVLEIPAGTQGTALPALRRLPGVHLAESLGPEQSR